MENQIPFTTIEDVSGNPVYVIEPDRLSDEQLSKLEQFFKLHKDESVSK